MMLGMKPHPSMHLPSDPWEAPTNALVAQLRARKAGSIAPRLNEPFPDFMLPDTQGRHISLADLIGSGPIVLSFLRGRWCPYCVQELTDWHDAMPRLEAQGGRFIAVSAETGGLADSFRHEIAPGAQMLCDVDHGLAMLLGLAFPIGDDLHRRYAEAGLNLAAIFGNSGRILPITATYVIDGNGKVRYAFADPDFRVRADPAVVIAVVEALRRAS